MTAGRYRDIVVRDDNMDHHDDQTIEWVNAGLDLPLSVAGCAVGVDQGFASGDWADVAAVEGGRRARITVGDAMGAGETAAPMRRGLRASARRLFDGGHPVDAVLARLDELVGAMQDTIASCVVADFDAAGRRVWVYNAGQPPPLVVCADGRACFLPRARGAPLGTGHAVGPPTEFTLAPGSTLVLYTDVLVEARTAPITAGLRRLAAAASGTHDLPVAAVARRLVQEASLTDTDDDVTVVVARAEGGVRDGPTG